jgi:hypothetical protein
MILAALLLAQTAPCTAMDSTLPAPLAGWTAPASAAPLDLGKAVTLKAADAATLSNLPKDAKPGGAATAEFRVATVGSYGIVLDQAGWIDVVPDAGGASLRSVAHGHGPECSTIRKIVRFQLQPGSYRLVLTGLKRPEARVMLVAPE